MKMEELKEIRNTYIHHDRVDETRRQYSLYDAQENAWDSGVLILTPSEARDLNTTLRERHENENCRLLEWRVRTEER